MSSASETLRLCTFVVGDMLLGLPVDDVVEVIGSQRLTPVPLAADGVAGLLNLRGRIVAAVDVRTRVGLPAADTGLVTAHVLVRHEGEQVSLVVDRPAELLTVLAADRKDVPANVTPTLRRLLTAAYPQSGALLLVLDPQRVIAAPTAAAPATVRTAVTAAVTLTVTAPPPTPDQPTPDR